MMSNTGLSPSSNTPASFSYTKTSSVPLLPHLIWPFLIILHSLSRPGHFILLALTCPPAPSRAQLRLRHARPPVPFGLLDPTRSHRAHRPPSPGSPFTTRGTPAGKPWRYNMVTTPTYPPAGVIRRPLSPCPESPPSPAGCVGSHRLPRFTLLRSLSMSRAHPQPLLGFRSIPATSAFFEPVRVRQPLRAPSCSSPPNPPLRPFNPPLSLPPQNPVSQLPPLRLLSPDSCDPSPPHS